MGIKDTNLEDFVVAEKRHRELIAVIKGIVEDIPETKVDLSSLNTVKKSIDKLLKGIESSNRDIVVKDDSYLEVVESIKNLSSIFTESFNELKTLIEESSRPKEYVFTVERSMGNDRIKKVIAKVN